MEDDVVLEIDMAAQEITDTLSNVCKRSGTILARGGLGSLSYGDLKKVKTDLTNAVVVVEAMLANVEKSESQD